MVALAFAALVFAFGTGCEEALRRLSPDLTGTVVAEGPNRENTRDDAQDRALAEAETYCLSSGGAGVESIDYRSSRCTSESQGPPYECTVEYRAWCVY